MNKPKFEVKLTEYEQVSAIAGASDNQVSIEVYSSCHWLDALKGVEEFESSAKPDEIPAA